LEKSEELAAEREGGKMSFVPMGETETEPSKRKARRGK